MNDRYSLLIVDDEPNAAEMMAEGLSSLGLVSTSSSYDAALKILNKRRFDLLITDIFLQGNDGIKLVREAIRIHPGISTVVITGFPGTDTSTQAHNLGVAGYLVKPFAYDELEFMCKRVLDTARKKNDPSKRKGFYDLKSPQMSGIQKSHLESALSRTAGNVTDAARLAKISKTGFYRYIKKHHIKVSKFRKPK